MPPAHAVSIWKQGLDLKVELDGHVFSIKLMDWVWNDDKGPLAALVLTLKNRERFHQPEIATPSNITQWDVVNKTLQKAQRAENRLAKALEAKAKKDAQEAEAAATAKELKKLYSRGDIGVSTADILKILGLE
jgi:hypothetical protein